MTLVDLAALNAMRAERDATLAENARLRAAVEGVERIVGLWEREGTERGADDKLFTVGVTSMLRGVLTLDAPTADDGAERGAR